MKVLIVLMVMLSWSPLSVSQAAPVIATEQALILIDPLIESTLINGAVKAEAAEPAAFQLGSRNTDAPSSTLSSSGMSPSRSIVKVIGALGVVLLVIFGVASIAKRTGLTAINRSKKLVLRETLTVGSKERLVVVDFAGESLLIGVASGKVSLVKSVPLLGFDSSELPAPHLGAKTAMDFQHKLNEFLLKGQK